MRSLLVALAVALIASGEAHAQVTTTQPTGPGASLCAPRTLSFGTAPVSASISAAGGVGCYRFDGVAGHRVRIRVLATSGSLDPAVTVSPNGLAPCVGMTADDASCILTVTGRHSITVADKAGTKTGGYAIALQDLNHPVGCSAALSYGTIGTLGQLVAAGDTECHRFTAGAGDRVRVQTQATPASPAVGAELIRPDGTPQCGISSGPLSCTAPVAGQYTLLVKGASPGGYGVSLQRLNNPVGCGAIFANNGPAPATIFAAAMTRCYRFDGDVGTRLRTRVVATGGALEPLTEVLRPDGTIVCHRTPADNATCALDADGDHTIVVTGDGAFAQGDFAIEVQRVDSPSACTIRAFGTLAGGDHLASADADCHRFTATAGDHVRVHVRSTGAAQPYVEILNPDGTARCTSTEITCPIQQTGSHTIVVTDRPPGTRTGGYYVSVQRLNDPVGCSSTAYGPTSWHGLLGIAETGCVRFEGAAGDRIRLRAIDANPMDLVGEVISPDGTTQCNKADAVKVTCVLDTTGSHTLLIRDSPGDAFGHFWATLQRLNDPVGCTTLSSQVPASGSIGLVESECWRFFGAADERIEIKLDKTWGSFQPGLEVLRPDGTTLSIHGGTTGTYDFFKDLRVTGTHTILVHDDDTGLLSGTYDIEYVR